MRKTLYFLFVLLATSLLTGCGNSEDNDMPSPQAGKIVGEWHLTSWSSETPEEFDVYVSFDGEKFTTYQKIESVSYEKYTGSYRLRNDVLSGKYSDSTPWGSTYTVEFDESGDTLTLTSATAVTEVSIYTRTTIPGAIKSGATVMKASRAGGFRFF